MNGLSLHKIFQDWLLIATFHTTVCREHSICFENRKKDTHKKQMTYATNHFVNHRYSKSASPVPTLDSPDIPGTCINALCNDIGASSRKITKTIISKIALNIAHVKHTVDYWHHVLVQVTAARHQNTPWHADTKNKLPHLMKSRFCWWFNANHEMFCV